MAGQLLYLQSQIRELSSVGSEHLPYKQRVTGSNPVAPTQKDRSGHRVPVFFFRRTLRLGSIELPVLTW